LRIEGKSNEIKKFGLGDVAFILGDRYWELVK
jgi:hypothetical protein